MLFLPSILYLGNLCNYWGQPHSYLELLTQLLLHYLQLSPRGGYLNLCLNVTGANIEKIK